MKIEIPPFLSHLKVDPRGYPIPFFVGYIDGKPDFRLLDPKKQVLCAQKHLCAICGKKIPFGEYYFISGPVGFKNQCSSDPPMHKNCGKFSLFACPHMYYEKAQRNHKAIEDRVEESSNKHIVLDKPEIIYLIKAKKYKLVSNGNGGAMIMYSAIHGRPYIYQNNILTEVL